jgi:hypothetical protein
MELIASESSALLVLSMQQVSIYWVDVSHFALLVRNAQFPVDPEIYTLAFAALLRFATVAM